MNTKSPKEIADQRKNLNTFRLENKRKADEFFASLTVDEKAEYDKIFTENSDSIIQSLKILEFMEKISSNR